MTSEVARVGVRPSFEGRSERYRTFYKEHLQGYWAKSNTGTFHFVHGYTTWTCCGKSPSKYSTINWDTERAHLHLFCLVCAERFFKYTWGELWQIAQKNKGILIMPSNTPTTTV